MSGQRAHFAGAVSAPKAGTGTVQVFLSDVTEATGTMVPEAVTTLIESEDLAQRWAETLLQWKALRVVGLRSMLDFDVSALRYAAGAVRILVDVRHIKSYQSLPWIRRVRVPCIETCSRLVKVKPPKNRADG